jgi:vitamin K-dependent gamma-carboxylase
MLGLFYRTACIVFLITFSWQFFIDQANYLNHFYLVILFGICFLMVPADQVWSLRRGARSNWIPRWSLLGLMIMIETVLIYAGLVKINSDWLQGWPLKVWFASRAVDYPLFGPMLSNPDFAVFSAWASMLLHLLGAPLLFFKRTRLIVFCLYALFHLSNALIFSMGIFPWMTLCATSSEKHPTAGWRQRQCGRWRVRHHRRALAASAATCSSADEQATGAHLSA